MSLNIVVTDANAPASDSEIVAEIVRICRNGSCRTGKQVMSEAARRFPMESKLRIKDCAAKAAALLMKAHQ